MITKHKLETTQAVFLSFQNVLPDSSQVQNKNKQKMGAWSLIVSEAGYRVRIKFQ